MIRKCTDRDKENILKYLYKDKIFNLFIIGDILGFGIDNDDVIVWIDEKGNNIKTVYMKFHNNLVIASLDNVVSQTFVDELCQTYQNLNWNGKKAIFDQIHFSDRYQKERKDCRFAYADHVENIYLQHQFDIRSLDVSYAVEYWKASEAVFHEGRTLQEITNNLQELKSRRTYGLFENGKLVSFASTAAECDGLAMIIGVGTLESYRRQHYASAVVARLVKDLLDEKKMPCLFYFNPQAARIYLKIGFQQMDEYYTIYGH